MKKKTIGIMGSSQIEHIIPLLKSEYEVINIQETLDKEKNSIKRKIGFFFNIAKIDTLYDVYVEKSFWRKMTVAHLFRKRVVCHWIGTDVREVTEGKINAKRLRKMDKHLSCFEPLQQQLIRSGLLSDVVPIVPFNVDFNICGIPTHHRVLIYMPKGKEGEYGYNEIMPAIKKFPYLQFDIVANDDKNKFENLDNVKLWGWVDHSTMDEIYNNVSIILRIHLNDGLSMSVLEAMAKGKKIIWNCKFEYCFPGSTTEEIVNSLNEIISIPPEVDIAAHNYIVENYSKDKILEMYKAVL